MATETESSSDSAEKNYEGAAGPGAKTRAKDENTIEAARAAHQSGGDFFTQRRWEDALREFDTAVEKNPMDPMYHHDRGHTLMKLGRLEEAEVAMKLSLSLDPNLQLAR